MKLISKEQLSWALYDWANSAFATTVMAGFFPIFFKEFWSINSDITLTTAKLGVVNSLSSAMVVIMVPFVGAIADYYSGKKKGLVIFAFLGIVMTLSLSIIPKGQYGVAMLVYGMACIGFSISNSLYDSLLITVAKKEQREVISSIGYGLGYFGGGFLFLVNVMMTKTLKN